jgi:hypothetical protein
MNDDEEIPCVPKSRNACAFCGHIAILVCGQQKLADKCEFNIKEKVNHPAHYGGDTIYETIKVLRNWMTPEQFEGFLVGNSIKYLSRYRHKGGTDDLRKSKWYLDYLLQMEQDK